MVERQPEGAIGVSDIVQLRTDAQVSGTGRISTITDLSRHWVTFHIAGGQSRVGIRVPVAWARLDPLARYTHTSQYKLLDDAPPHPSLHDTPRIWHPTVSPYISADDGGDKELEERIAKITNMHARAGERMRQTWKGT